MPLWDHEKNCPDCGREMMKGWLQVFSSRGCCFQWESDQEYPRPSRNPFRKGKLVDRSICLRLMANGLGEIDTQEDSWYCPECGRLFASFKVNAKDVSE